ncbi:hypothetical protein H696_06095 [Fonticula alba]|uniref:Signal recognition particle subunit SRP19 n=1 Tax=Fonticula alba TaxID=691883 RepID=A0A058Z033_FONAL|nr:hypothetical protein H696_06095 [Fonticula alba]KCV67456.1 hypothetical protein H696_06095 [Fonticula alba]|eukprot:XP_009498132.1 hypothetical protein H696_06095 [Fonticula alba]
MQQSAPPGAFVNSKPVDPQELKETIASWVCVYPAYFDSNCTSREGRRVALKQAVPSPTADEVCQAASTFGLSMVLESDRRHPRAGYEPCDAGGMGRIRIRLFNEPERGGGPAVAKYPNRMSLFRAIGENLVIQRASKREVMDVESDSDDPDQDHSPTRRLDSTSGPLIEDALAVGE